MRILVINGPNLNLLGSREPEKYGNQSLESIIEVLKKNASQASVELNNFQSNHEGDIIDRIQSAAGNTDAMILNAGAFTHSSIAIRDALLSVRIPFVEVHLSNVFSREEFRHKSVFADISLGVISGFGMKSYVYALDYLIHKD